MSVLKQHANTIIKNTLQQVLPDIAVKRALSAQNFQNPKGKQIVISVGKAAWTMAKAASDYLGCAVTSGIVLTKYKHSKGKIPNFTIWEAGHPVVDENSIIGTQKILNMVSDLTADDTIIFLISGGGSALFEKPAGNLSLQDLQNVSQQLLVCGADIVEINTIRKHISAVKGGRFAKLCEPASIFTIALSDILGNHLDAIASGPAYPDSSTCDDVIKIIQKYNLSFSAEIWQQLQVETPKEITNCKTVVTGSVTQLCQFAAKEAEGLGYTPLILSTMLDCEAKEAGRFLGSIAKTLQKGEGFCKTPCAVICGGETIVHLTGKGKGGRNQEIALSAAPYLDGIPQVLIAAIGSDGTDGPTDAAGGMVDGLSMEKLRYANISITDTLIHNNAYHALKQIDSLIFTGATGTNVNDLYFLLYQPT